MSAPEVRRWPSPRRIWAMARKELVQARRDPLSLAMLLIVPAGMLLLYGYAINFDVRHVQLAVQDADKSPASRELLSTFIHSEYFDLAADLPDGADLAALTERREARAILVIPRGYEAELRAGRRSPVQFLLDGADANVAATVLGYASALVNELNTDALRATPRGATLLRTTGIAYQPRVFYNPELRSTQFLVPGLTGYILMITSVLSTALSVVREKERGTMEQLLVTSLSPSELLIGKTLPYLGISLIATGVILVAARFLFGVAVRGSYLDLFVATLLYLIGALGFGLLVSSMADSQAMAFQIGAVTSMLPAIFLSGFIYPIRSMPAALQLLTYVVPTRYYLVVIRGVMLKGAGLWPYLTDLLFLALYGAVVLALAYRRLARREL